MKIFWLAALVAVFFGANGATADEHAPLAFGEREGFAANTGIARLGSSAAGWYNPAGLAAVDHAKISTSGSLFQNSNDDLTGPVSGHSNTFQSVPTQVSTVGLWGATRYAFSIFNLENFDYNLEFQVDLGGGLGGAPSQFKWTGSSLLVGPSIAIPIQEKLNLGLSLFVEKDDEYEDLLTRLDKTIGADQFLVLIEQRSNASTYSLVPIVGANYLAGSHLTLGLRWLAPTIPLSGSKTLTEQNVGYSVNGGNVTDRSTPESKITEGAKILRQSSIGVGARWECATNFHLSSDWSYAFQQNYKSSDNSDETKQDNSLRGSLGVEYGPPDHTWAAGYFYQQSPTRGTPGEAESYKGLTVGYIFGVEHLDTGVGLSYVSGSGSAGGTTRTTSNVGVIFSSSYKF